MGSSLSAAAILGFVQGLTEFIPVSSSGHLVIIREVLHWPDQGTFFDAVLHLATLAALIIYFWRDWIRMIVSVFTKAPTRVQKTDRRLFWLIVLATLPALALAPWLEPWVENNFRGLLPVAIMMIVVGIVFWVVDHRVVVKHDLTKLNPAHAFGIGLAQALAVIPGVSRSGATIVTGMYMELQREAAARFSFLMSAPIIAVAGGYALYQSIHSGSLNLSDYQFWLVAFGSSLVAGLLAIQILLAFLKKHSLDVFAYYRVIVGLGLLSFYFLR
jgi:undecaprenyl-diphosphatase